MKNETTKTTGTAAVADEGAQVAPPKTTSKKDATSKKAAPKGKGKGHATTIPPASRKTTKPTAKKDAKKPAAKTAIVPREFSKKAIVLDLLRRKDGATMAEIAKATDWQNHSIRGFISGTLGKKMGLTVESAKNEAGERTYRIAK